MKKVSLFILILCYFSFIPYVNAETDTVDSSTTTTTMPIIITTTTTEAIVDDITTTSKKTAVKAVEKKTSTTTTKKATTTTTKTVIEDEIIALSETEIKVEINKATVLVEAAEKSLIEEDYEVALNSVNKLIASEQKDNLLKRLEKTKLNIAVKENCPVNDKIECEKCKECNNIPWIILSVGLFICLATENIYLVYKNSKMYD